MLLFEQRQLCEMEYHDRALMCSHDRVLVDWHNSKSIFVMPAIGGVVRIGLPFWTKKYECPYFFPVQPPFICTCYDGWYLRSDPWLCTEPSIFLDIWVCCFCRCPVLCSISNSWLVRTTLSGACELIMREFENRLSYRPADWRTGLICSSSTLPFGCQ